MPVLIASAQVSLLFWQTGVMADDVDLVIDTVGERLRSVRAQSGTTLAQLAEATGISVSTLSRLESGQRRPTLDLLLRLARAHQVPLDDLVDVPPTGDPRVHARPFTRGDRTYVPLTRRPGGLQAYKLVIPPTVCPLTAADRRTHEGYDWLYVLSGRLRLLLGDRDLVLEPGEAAEFDTRTPHAFEASGDVPVEVLSLFGPQGERAHVRAKPARRQQSEDRSSGR